MSHKKKDRLTRGVHLSVSLGSGKAHDETYPYFIGFYWFVFSPLTEIQFLVLNVTTLILKLSISHI